MKRGGFFQEVNKMKKLHLTFYNNFVFLVIVSTK